MTELEILKGEFKKLVGMCEKLRRYVVVEAQIYNELGPVLDGRVITDGRELYEVKMYVRAAKIKKLWL